MNADAVTASSAAASMLSIDGVEWVAPKRPAPVPVANLFDVEVLAANVLVLKPRCELAKSLLVAWAGQAMRMQLEFRSAGPGVPLMKYGAGLEKAELTFASDPMLCCGDDPYFTGMKLSIEDEKVARDAVERARAQRKAKKSAALRKIIKPGAKMDELEAAGIRIEITRQKKRHPK